MSNKTTIIAAHAAAYGISKAEASRQVSSVLSVITSSITDGKLTLSGIGTFKTVDRAARSVRSLSDPTKLLSIPAKKAVKFKAHTKLASSVQ